MRIQMDALFFWLAPVVTFDARRTRVVLYTHYPSRWLTYAYVCDAPRVSIFSEMQVLFRVKEAISLT